MVAPQPISMSSLCAPKHRTFLIPSNRRPVIAILSAMLVPDSPWRLATREQIFQLLFFLKGVHARPEAVVRIGDQFSFGHQSAEWFFDQFLALLDVLENIAPKHKIASINFCAAPP